MSDTALPLLNLTSASAEMAKGNKLNASENMKSESQDFADTMDHVRQETEKSDVKASEKNNREQPEKEVSQTESKPVAVQEEKSTEATQSPSSSETAKATDTESTEVTVASTDKMATEGEQDSFLADLEAHLSTLEAWVKQVRSQSEPETDQTIDLSIYADLSDEELQALLADGPHLTLQQVSPPAVMATMIAEAATGNVKTNNTLSSGLSLNNSNSLAHNQTISEVALNGAQEVANDAALTQSSLTSGKALNPFKDITEFSLNQALEGEADTLVETKTVVKNMVETLAGQVGTTVTTQPTATTAAAKSQLMVATPFQQAQWGEAMAEKIVWMNSQGIQEADIHLDPPELGPITVKVSVTGDQASVSFVVQHANVREALDQHAMRLRELFAGDGLDLVDVDVSDQSQQQADEGEKSQTNLYGQSTTEGEGEENMGTTVSQTSVSGLSLVNTYV